MLRRLRLVHFACFVTAFAGCGDTTQVGAIPDATSAPDGAGVACGEVTCAIGQVCEGGECHLGCGTAARCGGASSEVCCSSGEICHLGACTAPGAACTPGAIAACGASTCPDNQYCDATIEKCLPAAASSTCSYQPPVGEFSPVVKWEWQGSTTLPDYNQIMMTPMVADLDGNCLPDVVFFTFKGGAYTTDGVLRAVKGDGSGDLFTVEDSALRVRPNTHPALADVDGDGKVEVFACLATGYLAAFGFDGTIRWITDSTTPCTGTVALSVADVDHDGVPEVLAGLSLVNAVSGAVIRSVGAAAFSTAVELDDDDANGMELVSGGHAYHADGTPYWDNRTLQGGANGPLSGSPAVADLDGDGEPDVVSVVGGNHSIWAFHHDGTLLWGPVDVNQGYVPADPTKASGGGPPTIADFDGDGIPDVATAGGYGYLVLKGNTGERLWWNQDTRDYSSRATGSSVFDFEGDGKAEAIYNDELNLRVYRGSNGDVLLKMCSTSGTLQENPVIVDVDGDDHAEIVVMNNNYAFKTCDADVGGGASHTGFKVIGDAQNRWVRTRRIWNQHAYHITNVNDDATVPMNETRNWTVARFNNFRQNVQPNDILAAPDLTVTVRADYMSCPAIDLTATVINQGAASAPAGLTVSFLRVDEQGAVLETIGTATTTHPLFAGATESVAITWTPSTPPVETYGYKVKAVLDVGPAVNQCDVTNDQTQSLNVSCPSLQ